MILIKSEYTGFLKHTQSQTHSILTLNLRAAEELKLAEENWYFWKVLDAQSLLTLPFGLTCCANHYQSLLQTWFEIQSLKSVGEHNRVKVAGKITLYLPLRPLCIEFSDR